MNHVTAAPKNDFLRGSHNSTSEHFFKNGNRIQVHPTVSNQHLEPIFEIKKNCYSAPRKTFFAAAHML